jgi:hypothetical protein
VAVKEFENFEYDFAKKQKEIYQKNLRLAAFGFGVLVLLFTCWALVSGINLFPNTSTQINKPVNDPTSNDEQIAKANQEAIDRYANVRIPYRDPENRFTIDFATPYLSDEIIVGLNRPDPNNVLRNEANNIIATAKKSVEINKVIYKENY